MLLHSARSLPRTSAYILYSQRSRACSARFLSLDTAPPAFLQPGPHNVTCLVLNRPTTRNAISRSMLWNIRSSLEQVNSKSTRCLILKSAHPDMFCSGADLEERRHMSEQEVETYLDHGREILTLLENLEVPTIAAIDGPALGGGLELALACDFRVGSQSARKIGLPETSLGIIPGFGGTQRAARLFGVTKAKELIFTATKMNAQQAKEFGIFNHLAEHGQTAYDRALLLASEIVQNAPLALKAAKLAISRAPELSIESGLDFEREQYQTLLDSKDRLEGLEAFKEGRPPQYKGE